MSDTDASAPEPVTDAAVNAAVEKVVNLIHERETAVAAPVTTTPSANQLDEIMNKWLQSNIHGSDVSRYTPAYNYLRSQLPVLRDMILKGIS